MSTRAGYAGPARRPGARTLPGDGQARHLDSGLRPAGRGRTRTAPRGRPSRGVPPVPSNKQRREAAQRRLQRQLERRAELARKRRRNLLIGVTAAAVVLVVGTVLLVTGTGGDDADPAAAEATPTSAAAPTPGVVDGSDGTCDWTPVDAAANPNLQADTGTPPVEVTPTGTTEVDVTTNVRSEEHTSELQSRQYLVCRLLLEKK